MSKEKVLKVLKETRENCCDVVACTYNETGCSDCEFHQAINKLIEVVEK